ncbi:hypothetical protein IAT40_004051 [Kwoniella sp. CBS 6097]
MSAYETVTAGRAKRSTAGNRMRELLEKAHQEDEDELFAEVEDDEEFAAPQDQRDVFLDEFADTDEEVEEDEEETERAIQREERNKAKGKSRAIYNPLANQPKSRKPVEPTANSLTEADLAILDPALDPSSMAPSTLMLALRRKRREVKRLGRSEARRSNLRASTLKTEDEIKAREEAEKAARGNKGRRPQHETGEVRGQRRMTQDELIAAALEEEERNKEALRDWLKKEDEKRELRRVGRKRVKGPRWTWVSRTVNRLVEVVEEAEKKAEQDKAATSTSEEPTGIAKEDTQVAGEKMNGDEASPTKCRGTITEEGTPIEGVSNSAPSQHQAESISAIPPATADADVPRTSPTTSVSAAQKSNPPTDIPTSTASPKNPDTPADKAAQPTTPGSLSMPVASSISPLTSDQAVTQAAEPDNRPSTDPSAASQNPATATPTAPTEAASTEAFAQPSIQNESVMTPSANAEATRSGEAVAGPSSRPMNTGNKDETVKPLSIPQETAAEVSQDEASQYTRNYLILSQVPGGLPAELKLVLGDHVEWDEVVYIPARNRPIVRRPPTCPFTGLPAKYRHPTTMIPYATAEGYKAIEGLLANRYRYDQGGWWLGGEEDVHADGMDEIEGWWGAVNGGWLGGVEIPPEPEPELEPIPDGHVVTEVPDQEMAEPVQQIDVEPKGKAKRKRGRGSESVSAAPEVSSKKTKGKRGRVNLEIVESEPQIEPELEVVDTPVPPIKKGKGKAKKQ